MQDLIYPTISGEPYDPSNVVRITDRWQQYQYCKHGLYPLDVYVSGDDMVFIFDKKASKPLYDLWRRYELK